MGKTIVHAGGAGNGQAAKICNNMILGVSMIAVSEAFVLAEKLGLDAQKLFDISSKSSGQCWSMTTYCPVPGPVPTSPANRDYQAGFTAAMMLKDLKLAQDAAKAAGARHAARRRRGENLRPISSRAARAARDFSGDHPLTSAAAIAERWWNYFQFVGALHEPEILCRFEEEPGWLLRCSHFAVPSPSGRKVPCEKCPLRGKSKCCANSPPRSWSSSPNFKSGELNVEAGTNILLQGTNSAHLYTVLSGWAFRYKTLPDGRRQILNYALPSDLLGLQGSVNDEMQHSVEALTDMMLCVFPREKLWDLYTRLSDAGVRRHLARGARGADARRELLNVGRRTAMERAGLSAAAPVSARRGGRA